MTSIICVTNRKGAAEYLSKQLPKQTYQDFEVIIADDSGDPFIYPKHFKPRQKNEADVWNLNKAYNDALDKAEGELIVFLQDFIWIPANGLERFWEVHQLFPDILVSGVGHKYDETLTKILEPDDRMTGEREMIQTNPSFYELNWSSAPNSDLRFDETMDTHYGGENVIYALNSNKDIYLDKTNECKGIIHTDRPDNWEPNHSNKGFLKLKIQQHGRFTIQ